MSVITFSTHAFPAASYSASVQFARRHHFDGVEILFHGRGFDEGGLLPSSRDVLILLRQLTGLRRTVHAPYEEVALLSDDPQERHASLRVMLACLEAAAALNAELVVIHLERQRAARHLRPEQSWSYLEAASDVVNVLADRAEMLGLVLGLENLNYSDRAVDVDPQWLVALVDRLARSTVGITFDLGHAQLGFSGAEPVRQAAALFGDRIRHYHVHDNDGSADQHTQLGLGRVDLGVLLPATAALLALEIFPNTPVDVEHALTSSLQVLRTIG
jgi:sugar phosphate isomerase/epimerase